jgi:hydrogenase nickel incorporation protein HypB
MEIPVVQKVLKVNDELAATNRRRFEDADLCVVNMMGGPGAGKTALIESVAPLLLPQLSLGVVEGDPESTLDAERIAQAGVPVVQIETAGGCHLEAHLVAQACDQLPMEGLDLLLIENVGNLVCPVGFDLGEAARVAVVSVTEGHDKPAKYPAMFRKVDVAVLNKIDLLPHVPFDEHIFLSHLEAVNPALCVLRVSCVTGEGISLWAQWLRSLLRTPAPA